MYKISKDIHFCYGHRLLNHQGKCQHLHGHNARAVIHLQSETLDELGMVCDFTDIGKYVKEWVETEIDHTLLLHKDDPFLPSVQSAGEKVFVMQHNPTAENIARLIYERVKQGGFPVTRVELFETASASASYSET